MTNLISSMEKPVSSKRNIQAIQWNPQNPAALSLPHEDNGNFTMDRMWADPGTGCNEQELTALIKIVTAHEKYMKMKQNSLFGGNLKSNSIVQACIAELSTTYRSAIRDCLSDWELSIEDKLLNATKKGGSMNGKNNDDENEEENIALLKIIYSVMHISDIFLPLLPSAYSWDYIIDPYQKPGIVTAATVRYLRYHHMANPEDCIQEADADEVDEMMTSSQPEEFKNGKVFWEYVRQLVLRGSLDMAWNILSKHSVFALALAVGQDSAAYDRDPRMFSEMSDVYQGFLQLKEIMLRAPIPGGRNDYYDDALGAEDRFDSEIDEAFLFMDGLDVIPGDYKFWETEYDSANGSLSADYPNIYNEKAATQKHRQWREYVKEVRSYFNLSKRIREIDSILAILCGDFDGVHFSSWAQKVCAELLYRCPDSSPVQISKWTSRIIEQFESDDDNSHTDAIVSIMEGDASTAIEVIYALGGASGAALPATIMSLLYNLFVDSSILPEDLAFRMTEFLCVASSAIVSSLDKSNPDIGVQLSVRLLIPYSINQKNVEIVSAIENILGRYYPSSDEFAETLISHVFPLLELKSGQILDSCVSILLCRYRLHKNKDDMARATHFLVQGILLESKVLQDITIGFSFKTLVVECQQTAFSLLNSLAGLCQFDPALSIYANGIALGLEQDNFDCSGIPEVTELLRVLFILDNYGKDVHERQVGNYIISCLEGSNVQNGDYKFTSRSASHWPLLRLACQLIDGANEDTFSSPNMTCESPFEKNGITLLLDCLIQLESPNSFPSNEINEHGKSLFMGLDQAIISENSIRKSSETRTASKRVDIDSIQSTNLNGYEISIQEQVVKRMLEH